MCADLQQTVGVSIVNDGQDGGGACDNEVTKVWLLMHNGSTLKVASYFSCI